MKSPIVVFLGLMQLRSAMAKLRRPVVFWSILQRYPGGSWITSLRRAMAVPALEMAFAAALLLPFSWTRLPACYGLLTFVAFASAAIYRRYHRGEDRFACGCSANLEEEMRASGMLLRNGVLLLAISYSLFGLGCPGSILEYGMGLALLLAFDLFQATLVAEGRVRQWKTSG